VRDSAQPGVISWKNKMVKPKPKIVVVKLVVVMLNAELMRVSVQIFAIIFYSTFTDVFF